MKRYLKIELKLDLKRGDVIILVILVLLLIFLFTSTLLILFNFWTKTTGKFLFGKEAKNFAKIGIEEGIWELDNDDREFDSLLDNWRINFEGDEVDLNGDGINDSKWFYIKDKKGNIIGRYAVLIEDESGKININSIGNLNGTFNEGYSTWEINILEKIIGKANYKNIVKYRYGNDEKPQKSDIDDNKNNLFLISDGIDNDGDGIIDEPDEGIDEDDEFDFEKIKGDDRPFFSPFEIKIVPGIGDFYYKKIKNLITTFSYDRDVNKNEDKRIDINKATLSELIEFFKKMNYPENQAIQISLNIVDFRDKDSIPTLYGNMTGIEITPYLNEIDAVMPWKKEIINGVIVFEEETGQFIELFNPYSKPINIGNWKIKGVLCLESDDWTKLEKKSKEIYDDIVRGETELAINKANEIQSLISKFITLTINQNAVIPPYSFYTIGDNIKIIVNVINTPDGIVVIPLLWPTEGLPKNCHEYKRIVAINPGSLSFIGKILSYIPFLSNIGLDFTIKLYDENDNLIEYCEYFADTPYTSVQKNDPRMKSSSDWFLGPLSPSGLNVKFQPEIGGEFNGLNWINSWQSHFYVKNNKFSTLGQLGLIHKMEQWKRLNFWQGIDTKILDHLTCYEKSKEFVYGRININTASKEVMECLPLVDEKIAEKIIRSRPFKEIGEIVGLFKDQGEKGALNREITKYGFDMVDNDSDGFVDTKNEKELVLTKIINLITVRSEVFKIISIGQKLNDKDNNGKIEEKEIVGERKICVWYDRNKKKIVYKREL